VTVSVTIDGESDAIGVYCGSKRPPMLMSPEETLSVTFVSRTGLGSGFTARFQFVTGGLYNINMDVFVAGGIDMGLFFYYKSFFITKSQRTLVCVD